MQLFLMRHGNASFDAVSDRERRLTTQGIEQTCQMSHWLATQVASFDLILVSPYIRALQTWQEVSHYFPNPTNIVELNELMPSADPQMTAQSILAYSEHYQADKVLVISHMPLLGYLFSELVPGMEPPLVPTSGISRIEITEARGDCIWQQAPHTLAELMSVTA